MDWELYWGKWIRRFRSLRFVFFCIMVVSLWFLFFRRVGRKFLVFRRVVINYKVGRVGINWVIRRVGINWVIERIGIKE